MPPRGLAPPAKILDPPLYTVTFSEHRVYYLLSFGSLDLLLRIRKVKYYFEDKLKIKLKA